MQISSNKMQNLLSERHALIDQLPWSAQIFLPTEAVPMEEQVAGLKKVVAVHTERLKSTYAPKMRQLKEKYDGRQRCFIIGNGPSLNKTDLAQLRDEVTFCVNGFFLKMQELSWTPTFYVVEDHLVAEDRSEAINLLDGPTKLFPTYLAYCIDEGPDTIFFNHRARKSYPHGFDFSTDASTITYTGCTVTFTCIQLAHYLGFKEIYLVGVDADYEIPKDVDLSSDYGTSVLDMESDDPNHFHPDYFGKGFRWHDPQVEKMIEAYQEARRVTDASGRPVYNATVGGKLDVFERRAFSDIFPEARSETEIVRSADQTYYNALPTHLSRYPKVGVIGASAMESKGSGGLFAGWPRERVLYVESAPGQAITSFGGPITPTEQKPIFTDESNPLELLRVFDPDVLLYAPNENANQLQQVFENAQSEFASPYILWVKQQLSKTSTKTWSNLLNSLLVDATHRMTTEDFHHECAQPIEKIDLPADRDWLSAALRSAASRRRREAHVTDPADIARIIANGQLMPNSRTGMSTYPAVPGRSILTGEPMRTTAKDSSRGSRMMKFYRGWRGLVAGASVGAMSWPAVAAAVAGQVRDALIWTGPALAVASIFVFFAYLFTLIEDHCL